MKSIVTRVVLIVICLVPAMAAVNQAADPAGERLFVLLAPFEIPSPGTIAAFDIGPDGIPVQAESYPTGGLSWGRRGPQDLVIDPSGKFLFAANNEGRSIAAYTIREDDGTLEPVPGTPFPATGLPVFTSPFFLAVTPDASFLYASTDRGLAAYDIDDRGALEFIEIGPLLAAGLATSPDGSYLYAIGFPDGGVHSYRITASGALVEVDGSPFLYDDISRGWRLVVSEDGRRLWLLDLDTGIAAFDADDQGALHFTGQTPVGDFAEAFESAVDDRYLYAGITYEPEIRGYDASGPAPRELAASPFTTAYGGVMLVATPDGSRLYYTTRDARNISTFAIDPQGGLAQIGEPAPIDAEGDEIPAGASYLASRVVDIAIDVKPGSDRNPVNLRGRGLIPVAILGTDELDVLDLDQASVRFGPGEAFPAHALPHGLEDIDGDGDLDVVLHFRVDASGIGCGDTAVSLVGSTFDGRELAGRDSVDVLGCRRQAVRAPVVRIAPR